MTIDRSSYDRFTGSDDDVAYLEESALPERFETMREAHKREYWRGVGPVCMACSTTHTATANGHPFVHDDRELVTWPCDTINALDALDMAMTFIEHTAYDEWRAGELLQEAKAVIDQIGGEE